MRPASAEDLWWQAPMRLARKSWKQEAGLEKESFEAVGLDVPWKVW